MRHDDRRLWAIAIAVSLLGNVVIFAVAGIASLATEKLRTQHRIIPQEKAPPATVLITPDMIQKAEGASITAPAPTPPPRAAPPEAVRTSEEQRGKRPDKPAFIGERDTEATSDRTPDPTAPLMPSQRGIDPRSEDDIETTESRYRDGPLSDPGRAGAAMPTPPAPSPPPTPLAPETPPAEPVAAAPTPPASPSDTVKMAAETPTPAVPPSAELLEGTSPVEVPVPKPTPEKGPPPTPPSPPENKTATKATPEQKPPTPKPATAKPGEPGFSGNQRKTAIRGSISRSGRSALDVADTPLGRYQAIVSRAVEQEWQRNCVRHRDMITPGFLTVRFFIEPSGRVKSVQFVGDMQTGEVQKGFTLNSIRDANIPAMPKEIRGDYADESLELIFNFYF